MGNDAPPITPKVKEWIELCIQKTDPQYTEVHSVMYKFKNIIASFKL